MPNLNAFIETKFKDQIRAHKFIDKIEGEYINFPDGLHPGLREVLINQGITKLYSHQKEAFQSIEENKNTLLVSSTASGKTLSFFLPIINQYMFAEQPFTVLLLYPTKALSRDQENTFGILMEVVKKSGKLGTFDGDTPREERDRIQKTGDFIITNPDMLHNGILPNHNRRWKGFLSRLRYIVVDEVHSYRGAFGSHVSNVFRRLMRVCEIHGSHPVFVCSSATIRNPGEHAGALFHCDFNVILKDGAPKSPREFYFINPPLEESQGYAMYRKGTSSVSIPLLREALKNKIRTICFCRARQEVERLYRAVVDGRPEFETMIKPYRGGLLPNERRSLEKDLSSGKITAIITTNALELGIDIGGLDLCILSGHPGTIASFRQQSGRVGRKDRPSLIVFIAKDKSIDQYLVHHPDFFDKTPVEEAWLSADNPYILLQHLPCAAQEHPLRENEPNYEPVVYKEALELLKRQKLIIPYHENYRYAGDDYPARGVNLRGMTDYNIDIYCGTEVIGELDPIGARGTLYKDAIYQHLGRRYMSLELDLEKKLCRVEEVNVDYYTEAVWEGQVEMTESYENKTINGAVLEFGGIHVKKQPKLYKKIRERTYENIGYGPITLPPFDYNTTGFSIFPPGNWAAAMIKTDKRYIETALYGLSYLLNQNAPGLCMADTSDILTDISLIELDDKTWKSTLYIFDSIEGGAGYSEKIYERIAESLKLCLDVLDECECEYGCPSCAPPLPPGISNQDLQTFLVESNVSIECTRSLLIALLEGRIYQPGIIVNSTAIQTMPAPPEDEELKKMKSKLNRAMANLIDKKERLH